MAVGGSVQCAWIDASQVRGTARGSLPMDGGVLASVCAIVDGQAHCSFTGAPDGASDEDAGSEEREDGERPRPPFTLRPVPLATRLLEVEVGAGFACGRRESGEVLCWGSNFDGVLAPHRSAEPAVIPLP